MEKSREDAKETKFDYVTDVVVVGTGGGGFTAALAAREKGKDVLMLESTELIGGCTAKSGGGMWVPNNSIMKEAGVSDSHEEARAYLDDIIGDVGPASSPDRREAYLTEGVKMVEWLKSIGVEFTYLPGYCDYYPHNKGGSVKGRGITPKVYNIRKLGEWGNKIRALNTVLLVYNHEVAAICKPFCPRGIWTAFKVYGVRRYAAKLIGKKYCACGSALIAWLLEAALKRDIKIWLESPMVELIEKDGRVIGVVIEKDKKRMRIKANQGVVLAAGGFAKNQEMREKYLPKPTSTEWSCASDGDKGDAIRAGMAIGAETALMEEAWGGPVFPYKGGAAFILWERSNPHSIMVDSKGNRFMNESASYTDAWHWTYEAHAKESAIPAYLIFDTQHRHKYAFIRTLPYQSLNIAIKANTLEELAKKCDIDPNALVRTVTRFNELAKIGKDSDFNRGDSAYDRFYSDPSVKPNPNLGPILKPPFYAVKLMPGELSTKGGLLTDEYSRVIHKNGSIIKGLYCTGNSSASVTGRVYPGPGASVGPTTIFGYIAGKHVADLSD